MKRVRFLIAAVVGALGVGLMAGVLAFNSGVQTYFVRRALAAHPELHASIGRVNAGWQHVEVEEIRIEQDGALLTLPRVEADLPLLSAAFGEKLLISRLVAGGWTLDLSVPARSAATPVTPADAPAAVAAVFSGVLRQIKLPVDFSIDALQLEGEVILPDLRGRVRVVVQGGDMGVGRTGRFELKASAELTDPAVSAVRVAGALTAAMDTPRTLARLDLKLDATATGVKFPQGVKLSAELAAARAAAGETYRAAFVTDGRQLLLVQATLPAGGRQLDGTWQVEVRDADVAPFALGRPLPSFALSGGGRFDTDAAFTTLHATGSLNAGIDRLEAVIPALVGIGAGSVSAEFDLARDRDRFRVQALQAKISAAQPVAVVRALQAFEILATTGAIKPSAPERELFDLVLEGVPLAWIGPFVPGLEVRGSGLRGELTALARADGFSLRTKAPLSVANLAASWRGQPMIIGADFGVRFSADYTPQGWQAEIENLNAKSGSVTWLTLSGKAGQLPHQPLKATGTLLLDLPAALAQPMAASSAALARGEARLEFVASVAARQEFAFNFALRQLATAAERMPDVTAQVRADVSTGGQITINAPVMLEHEGRKSDLTVAGTLQPGRDGLSLEADIGSLELHLADAKIFAGLVPEGRSPGVVAGTPGQPESSPPWAGLRGTVAVHLKKVIYSDLFQISDVAGTLRVEPGVLTLAGFKAGLGEGGSARVDGAVTFLRATPEPYALEAALAVSAFDPAPLFRALNPGQPPTVEGRFNIESKLVGRSATLGALAAGAGGDFQLTSTGGTFRGLPVSAAAKLEATGAFAAGIARLGSLASAISGKNDRAIENVANKAQAIAELANYWKAIPYDQLSVTLSRDAARNATLKNFTLISPEIRLSGQGQARHRTGASLLDDELGMEFKLRARGHHAELLKYVGVLEEPADELGYAACALPLKVTGTLGKPDTTELNEKLAALALEKSGVGDKAFELLNRLRGGAKQ